VLQKQVAFIEFETDDMAGAAMSVLNGYTFREPSGEEVTLRVTYMRK
jgi:hypothetical protein